jgi:thiamine biosynthesis protein ThiS
VTHSRVPRLMLVTDRRSSRLPLSELASLAVTGGVDVVQVREKDLNEEQLRSLVRALLATIGDPSKISVNGSLAVAGELDVGLHLPESSLSPAEARNQLGANAHIGRSVHSPEAAPDSDGADYLIAGHVFATTSKADRPPIGLEGLRLIVDAASCPVLAIGGVTASNVRSVLSAGAHGVAVISAINNADDPLAAAQAIREQICLAKEHTPVITATKVEVTINGKQVALDDGTTVQQFLHSKGYQDRLVVVELNESILPRGSYSSTILASGDRVEIVHFVGGG